MFIIGKLLAQVEGPAASAVPTQICIGAHWTCVAFELEGQIRGGLASTLSGGDHDYHHGGRPLIGDAGRLLNKSARELTAMADSDSLLEASVGMAAINALLPVDATACVEVNAADVIAEKGLGRKVAVVGHFPFVPGLRDLAETLWVLELNPRPGDLAADHAPEVLPQADVVALTGTSLLNKTFDDLIELCRPDAYVVVLGATTPLSPVLFDMGIDAVSGTVVVDTERAMLAVSQGATFRQIGGKRLLTMFRSSHQGR
ncbi:MAG: Rossmann-like domain-containing protein [Anaerolineae bacterium]